MCGIAGFVGLGSRVDLHRMTNALEHRGPDSEGFYVDDHARVYLGHRRLAIVDIADGAQPMWNDDRTIAVVFNGEIYNHQSLREELVARGHRFASDHSDTEVLVHGYKEWGHDLPVRLNGMFAFAIYDKPRRRLFLARDRFGEKPLYYSHASAGHFAFASELTALAEHGHVSHSIDFRSLQKLMGWGYLPAPNAMLEGVQKLPGGCWLQYDTTTGQLKSDVYWRFRLEPDDTLCDDDEAALVDELQALLEQAARRRLMSDVPLGVFLSGGLDSSTVLGVLAQQLPAQKIETFTVGFSESSFDESQHARTVARHFGSHHHERLLDIERARQLIPELLDRLDEPLGDASLLPTHLLSAFTRERVIVALSGDGGDELFAGYDPFLALAPSSLYEAVMPQTGHRVLRRLADLLPMSHKNMSLDFKVRRTLMGLSYSTPMRLPVWMSPLEPRDLADLCRSEVRPEELYSEAIALWDSRPDLSAVDRALEFFTTFYLQDNILAKVDRASMMCSLETRAVFLDNDLVDFARRLPSKWKLRGRQRKYLLKKVARRLLPSSIVDRKKKGFGIPLARWLKDVPPLPPLEPLPGVSSDWAARAWACLLYTSPSPRDA